MNIKEHFETIRKSRDEMKGTINHLQDEVETMTESIRFKRFENEVGEEVLDLLQKYAALKESEIEVKIDNVISRGLRAILPDEDFTSKIDFDIKRGQAVAETKLIMEGMKVNIENADSGGVANVVGFLYQLLVLAQKKPRQRQLMVADEPFKNLSKEYLEATGEFMRTLADRLDIQIVLITHQEELTDVGDRVYRFTKVDNRTKVALESSGVVQS